MNFFYCMFCIPGLFLASAYDDISYKKEATQSHTGIGQVYDASNAVDRKTATCMRTLPIGHINPDKTVWWKVDLGEVYSIHSINILFRNYNGYEDRQKGRLAGFSLYVSNTGAIQGSTLCYKDGPQVPPLNLTITCAESGRYVIFYNERIDGVSYPTGYELENVFTELCEVIVQGCNNSSFYGSNCDIPCPANCKDSTCNIQKGACFTCKPGWTDMHCNNKCKDKWYGLNCSQQCVGHCRDGASCNHVTGQCDTGCAAGWTGAMCDNECLTGYFGLDCKERCSGQCAMSKPCDHVSGMCHSGCQDGYQGNNCNNYCKEGYFGINCSLKCSPNCKSEKCRHTDGWCTCDAGLKGGNCTTGRTDNILIKQDTSGFTSLIIGLSISTLINLILVSCGIILCRRMNSNRLNVFCRPVSCWKKSVYQDIVVKTDAASTYQELGLSDSAYQNATIRQQT